MAIKNKDKTIVLRVTENEKKFIEKESNKLGLSVSSFLRYLALKSKNDKE